MSLYLPEQRAVERSGSSFWSFMQHQRPRAHASGSTTGSARRIPSFFGWLSGKQRMSPQQKAVTRYPYTPAPVMQRSFFHMHA